MSGVVVGQSRYGEMAVHVNEATRAIAVNNTHCRGVIEVPKALRINDRWRRFPDDMIGEVLAFAGCEMPHELDRLSGPGVFVNEVCNGNVGFPVYVAFHGLIQKPQPGWGSNRWREEHKKEEVTSALIEEDGRVRVDSSHVPEFWLHFDLPPTLIPQVITTKKQRSAVRFENMFRASAQMP